MTAARNKKWWRLSLILVFIGLAAAIIPARAQQSAFEIRLVSTPVLRLKGDLSARLIVFKPFPVPAKDIPVKAELSSAGKANLPLATGKTDAFGSFVLKCPAPELDGSQPELLFTLGGTDNPQTFSRKITILPDALLTLDTGTSGFPPDGTINIRLRACRLSDGAALPGAKLQFKLTHPSGCLYRKELSTNDQGWAYLHLKYPGLPGACQMSASYDNLTVSRALPAGDGLEGGMPETGDPKISLNPGAPARNLSLSLQANTQNLYLDIAQGTLLYSRNLELKDGHADLTVNPTDLNLGAAPFSGELRVYYWNDQGSLQQNCLPLNFTAEDSLKIAWLNLKNRYLPGEQVRLEVAVTDRKARPLPGCLSFTLFRESRKEILKYEPQLLAGKDGKAGLDFLAPLEAGEIKLQLQAWGDSWQYGEAEHSLKVFGPLGLELSQPCNLFTAGDAVNFPLKITNRLAHKQKIIINIVEEDWFKLAGSFERKLTLEAGKTGMVTYPVKFRQPGEFYITFYAQGETTETLRQSLKVLPEGALRQTVNLGWATDSGKLTLPLPADAQVSQGLLTLYPHALSYLAESYFPEPLDFYQAYVNLFSDYLALSRPELKYSLTEARLCYDLGNLCKYQNQNPNAASALLEKIDTFMTPRPAASPQAAAPQAAPASSVPEGVAVESNPSTILEQSAYWETLNPEPVAGKVKVLLNRNKEYIAGFSALSPAPVTFDLGILHTPQQFLKFFLPPGQKCWYKLALSAYGGSVKSSSQGIAWELDYPKRINLNQEFALTIKIFNNTAKTLEGLDLNLPLPAGFTFLSSGFNGNPVRWTMADNSLKLYLPELKNKEGLKLKLPFKAGISGIIQSRTPVMSCRNKPDLRLYWSPVKLLIFK